MNKYLLLLGVNILLLVAGQCVWKIGMQKIEAFTIANLIQSAYIWAGVVIYALATILWLKILSMAPLSVAYPMQSLAYVLGMVAAYLFFGEMIPLTRWFGAVVIFAGVVLISL